MTVLLDTNILIDFFHGVPSATEFLRSLSGNQLQISVLTVMEIVRGAHKTNMPKRYIDEFKNFLVDFSVEIKSVTETVAVRCGELVAIMERDGVRIGVVDALLAATALEYQCVIATDDKIFQKVPGLDIPFLYRVATRPGPVIQ